MNTGLRLILLWIKLCTKRQVHQSVTKVSLDSDRCSDIDATFRSKSTLVLFVDAACEGRKVPRIIGRILLTLAVFAVTGFVLLVLIGLWDRYEKEATALGFSGPYERYLASQAGFLNDPKAYHAAMFERAPQGVVGPETTASIEE
jgi:hypothetical protein